MARAKRYSMEQIQAAQKMLRALTAKKSGKTKKEVVELLAADISKAAQQGHSLQTIQDVLGKAGIVAPLVHMKPLVEQTGKDSPQNGQGEDAGKAAEMVQALGTDSGV